MALRTARRLVVAVARLVAPPAEPGQPKAQAASVRSVVESSVHRTVPVARISASSRQTSTFQTPSKETGGSELEPG